MRNPLLLLVCCLSPAGAERPAVVVDLGSPEAYRFEGWGTSLCWWGDQVGDWPDADLDPLVELLVDPRDGLGLTVFRYNIGGGDHPTHDHMRPGGEVPGYQAGPDAPLDPDADPRQRRVLQKLVAAVEARRATEPAAAPIVEGWANSPPWWATQSGCAAGGERGGPNLRDDRIDVFAEYLAGVTLLLRDRHGIRLRTLDPLNEPNSNWWKTGGNQEGCHVPERQQAPLLRALHAALDRRGLAGEVAIAATDAHSIDETLRNLRALDPATLALVGQINTHTYAGEARRELREFAAAAGKRLWQSESGPMNPAEGVDPRLAMMERVALDLNNLRAAAWVMWQGVDREASDWPCVVADPESHGLTPNENFGLYAQFTRHVRPGDRVVPTADPAVAVALSDAGRVTIVTANPRKAPATKLLRLAGLGAGERSITAWRSTLQDRHVATDSAELVGTDLTIEAAPESVTTVELNPRG